MEPPSETDERDTFDSLRRRCCCDCEGSEGSPPTTSRAEDHDVALLCFEWTFRSFTRELG